MRFVDPLPPSSPSLKEQADALRKGLGRAMQWGLAGKLEDGTLLQACLHDHRHDMQIEDSRGTWLWKIVQAVRGEQRFREPLLEEFKRLPDERSAYQLCELASFYAAMGDADFRQRLYEIVEENPVSDSAGLGEEEILRLDGGKGLLFAAGIRGQRLENREWDWDDGQLIHIAIEQLGEDQVLNLLKNSNDRRVQRFYEISLDQKNPKSDVHPQQKHKEKMQAISVHDIIVEAERESPANFWFRGWGMYAGDEDLNTILEALWEAEHPKVLVNYLRIFSGRAMPTFHARMIGLCNHADEQVRHWAFKALQMNRHPLVREFAVTNLSRGLR
ncbi:MAG: hypothetical protein KDA68_01385, partial [Planctomycetaceae bacterium]|nr:hypothetical protein [Planctomycetaceae bacterium]